MALLGPVLAAGRESNEALHDAHFELEPGGFEGEKIAAMLRKSKKKVRLVINKADFGDEKVALDEAYRLGFGEPLQVSAEHGRGVAEMLEIDRWALARARLEPVPARPRPQLRP